MIFKFFLKMHVGNPSEAIIKVGDFVKRGECIAIPVGLGAKIHSSVNGTIKDVTTEAIYIQAEKNLNVDYIKIKDCKTIAEYAYEAGIVGAGGAGFPTHLKLKTEIPDGYVIANCVECEPGLEHNITLLEKNPLKLIKGIIYAMQATRAKKGYIAIKKKNEQAVIISKKIIEDLKYNIEIIEVKDSYPMGEERAIIHAIFNEWIDADKLPSTMNCVVLNLETLVNLTEAVEEKKPVIDKDLTVIGDFKNKKTKNIYLNIPIGTPIKELTKDYELEFELGELVLGGPYTGVSGELEEAYLSKTLGGVIFTIPFPEYKGPVGLLVCACGANEDRLRELAEKMKASVVAVAFCKNIAENKKCMTPGVCPGQVKSVIYLKTQGAKRIIISNCNDCSNTVMCCAPKLGLGVYHATDHIFRTINYSLSRRLSIEE